MASLALRNHTQTIEALLLDRLAESRAPNIVGRAPTMTAALKMYQIQVSCSQSKLDA